MGRLHHLLCGPAVPVVCGRYAEASPGQGQAGSLRLAHSPDSKTVVRSVSMSFRLNLRLPGPARWSGCPTRSGRQSLGLRALKHLRAQLRLEVLTAGVLHGQPIAGGHVHLHARWHAELNLLQQDGQEEKDLPAAMVPLMHFRLPMPKRITFSLSTLLIPPSGVRNRSGRNSDGLTHSFL